ncbi:MAG: hypothetical protein IIU08_08295, partial [Clostridia bacterium]|nr:hypothetical protein [Clostridia bacterium]
ICARLAKQIPPHENAATPNARLNFCRQAAALACRSAVLFIHPANATDRARLAPCSGSSGLNLKNRAKIALFPG